jgi:hypothetical protein
MDDFDIIGTLRAYAVSQGWRFTYGLDSFYRSAQTIGHYSPGDLILVIDFNALPVYKNGKTISITYTCLMMLGRKFDLDGQVASLDETSDQKYDRRLLELMQLLSTAIADISCQNELEASTAPMGFSINEFAENIDFAVSDAVTFIQG